MLSMLPCLDAPLGPLPALHACSRLPCGGWLAWTRDAVGRSSESSGHGFHPSHPDLTANHSDETGPRSPACKRPHSIRRNKICAAASPSTPSYASSPPPQVDWRDRANWNCNNNVHPSRHGTYDGVSMHPFETVFVKASWHVGGPFVDKYADWMAAQVGRRSGWTLMCCPMGGALAP